MIRGPGFTRPLQRGEEDAVDALLRAAFPNDSEAKLVRKLRKAGLMAGESVMPLGDEIVGYFALSKLVAPKGWLAVAPVAVRPDVQGRGYGKRMMGMLSEWARLSQTPVVVIGAPAFYGKAGFSRHAAKGLTSSYPAEATLIAGVSNAPQEKLVFPAPFDDV